MARKNILKVIEAFIARKAAIGDSKKTCWTDGEAIYSYQMVIGRRMPSGHIWISPVADAPSATTRLQIYALQNAFATNRALHQMVAMDQMGERVDQNDLNRLTPLQQVEWDFWVIYGKAMIGK